MDIDKIDTKKIILIPILAVVALLVVFFVGSSISIVGPNERGVRVTLGSVSNNVLDSGIAVKWPAISEIHKISVATQNNVAELDVFSKDLQSVEMRVDVIYHYTPENVVKLVTDFKEDPVKTVLTPMVHETLKEICKDLNSEEIVQKRDQVSKNANELLSKNMAKYDIFTLERLVITNVELSPKLNQAIEAKMIQEQEAQKALFTQKQKETEAETQRIIAQGLANAEIEKAKGKAKAIELEAAANASAIEKIGKALTENPLALEELKIKRWDGVMPKTILSSGTKDGGFGVILNTPQEK